MILSYGNSTDDYLDLNNYLLNHNETNNHNIIIELKNNIKIENNIFGYIYSHIQIIDKINCNNISLISSTNNLIETIYNLQINENIILNLDFSNNQYYPINCTLKYRYVITEPELDEFDDYCKIKNTDILKDNAKENFIKQKYIGKISSYNIFLKIDDNNIDKDKEEELEEEKQVKELEEEKQEEEFEEEKQEEEEVDEKVEVKEEKVEEERVEEEKEEEEIIKEIPNEINEKEKKNNNYINIKNNNITTLNISKEKLFEDLDEIVKEIEIGENYKIKGEDFTLSIYPINSTVSPSSTHVNFSECESILREYYNISPSVILTFFQLEINNNNSKSLVNNVEYQVYDNNKIMLDLNKCNDANIKIFYSIKDNSLIDMLSVSSFNDIGIDIFNINDSFFNDICQPYSNSNNDLILKDRIKEIYQNYSLCDEGCQYIEFSLEYKTISCDCKVKSNMTINDTSINLNQFDNIKTDSNFGIIKCYNLVFSFKGKLSNFGFWIFLLIVLGHIPLLIIYFYNGLKPIEKYIISEMVKNGYIRKDKNSMKSNKKRKKNVNKKNPPKKVKINKNSKKNKKGKYNEVSKRFKKIKSIKLNNGSSINNLNKSENKIIDELNSDKRKIINTYKKTGKIKQNKKSLIKNKTFTGKNSKIKKINEIQTQGEKGINGNTKNIINFSLIKINLKNTKEYTPKTSNHILNNYSFEEAVKHDMRSICTIFYIFLLSKQAILHAFLFKSPLSLFSLRLCLLLFIISSDLALNAFFYLDDKISEKYRYTKNLFLFTFNNNITVILLSTLIGFIFLTLFTKLSNSSNAIRNIFIKEEEKLKQNKKYIVTDKRKKEILNEIETTLKKYKIKVIIFIIFELLLEFFFFYYVTAFCHVYSNTQVSWLLDSLLSMISRIIIDCLISLLFAKLYRMAVEANTKSIYNCVLLFYSFG